ncbi:MAG: formylglycine-generating enzyme family protein [Acidobacteria bacterium]|nr:formylglycine-generating enzyme family protein [Acidobacteriota bacterium]
MKRVLLRLGYVVIIVVALPSGRTDCLYDLIAWPETPAKMSAYVETIPGTDIKFELVPVSGGTFTMGSPANEPNRRKDEGPQHEVRLKPFWMGKTEVTWDEYDLFAFSQDIKRKQQQGADLAKQPETEKTADAVTRPTPPYADETFGLGRAGQPALCITWHAAMEYCRWLSAKTGKTYRLPTEAEWEYACRAGSKTAYSFGGDPAQLKDYAWYSQNSDGKPQKVGSKKPNVWGLYDLHGNVAEWCLDHYDPAFYGTFKPGSPALFPVLLPTDKRYPHVARGGSWDDDAPLLRAAARRGSEEDWSMLDPQQPKSIWWHTNATFVGFRVVRPLEEQENLKGLRSKVIKN